MAKKPHSGTHVAFELSDHLPYLFKHIHSQLEVASAGELAKFGINVAVWRILAVLWEHDDLSHRELAHLTSIEVSTLSRISKTVQRDGLIRRTRTEEDQRTVRVKLTEKGRELAQSVIPWALKTERELFANIPAEDIKTLTRILNDVAKSLNRYTEADLDIVGEPVDYDRDEPRLGASAVKGVDQPKPAAAARKAKAPPPTKPARARKATSTD